jgi:hypothetical protein
MISMTQPLRSGAERRRLLRSPRGSPPPHAGPGARGGGTWTSERDLALTRLPRTGRAAPEGGGLTRVGTALTRAFGSFSNFLVNGAVYPR